MIQTTPVELPDGRRIENIAITAADTSTVQFRIVSKRYSVPCFMDRDDFKAFRGHVERGGDPDTWFAYKPTADADDKDPVQESGITARANQPVMEDIDAPGTTIDRITITDAPNEIASSVSAPNEYRANE